MTFKQPLRIAFIGGYGHSYLRGALADPAIEIEATAFAPGHNDKDVTRSRFAEQLQREDAQWFDDPIAMLDAFRPSVVNVGTVYAHQWRFNLEATRRGIPVVCDKPIAASWEHLAELERAIAEHAGVIATEFDFRSRKTFRAAQKAVAEGLIGEPVLATAQKSYRFGDARPEFYKRRADYGSTLLWIASHGIDAIRFVTGRRFTRVVAQHGNLTRPEYGEMEDHCSAMYTLDNGATGIAHGDLLRPAAAPTHGDDRLRVVGSLGQLEVRGDHCTVITQDKPSRDIVESVTPDPIYLELLNATLAGDTRFYSSAASLELARVLLHTRDAADCGETVVISA